MRSPERPRADIKMAAAVDGKRLVAPRLAPLGRLAHRRVLQVRDWKGTAPVFSPGISHR